MGRQCFFCGSEEWIESHHVYGGAYRKKSPTVDLCHYCHNEPPYGVHHNQRMNHLLKEHFQRKLMDENGWTTEKFIEEFGKNYVE